MPEIPEALKKYLSGGEGDRVLAETMEADEQAQILADVLIGKFASPSEELNAEQRIQALEWFEETYPLGIDGFKKRMSGYRENVRGSIFKRLEKFPELLERIK